VFTGHKSLLGPTGIGGLYVREGVKINHTRAGDTGIRSAVRTHLDDYPYRLEYGTPNIVGIAGLQAGVAWIRKKGISNIRKHEMVLTKLLQESLADINGITTYCQNTAENHIGVFSFNINGMEAINAGTVLDSDYSIACRTGLHSAPLTHNQLGTHSIQGSVRLSIGPFNTESHIQWVIKAIKQILVSQKKQIYEVKTEKCAKYE
jgi:selenocysteine lyase/cysteine desulfurase